MKIKMANSFNKIFSLDSRTNEPESIRVFLFGVHEDFDKRLFRNFRSVENMFGDVYLQFDNCKIYLLKDMPTLSYIARMIYDCPETKEEKWFDVRDCNKYNFIKLFKELLRIRENNFNERYRKPVFQEEEKEKEYLPKSKKLIDDFFGVKNKKPEPAKTSTVPREEKFLCGYEFKTFPKEKLERATGKIKIGYNFTWIENGLEILFIVERYEENNNTFICAVTNCRELEKVRYQGDF
jgi:hypothetical protein